MNTIELRYFIHISSGQLYVDYYGSPTFKDRKQLSNIWREVNTTKE